MARWVALFRGINVGRAKRIAMADLRALLEAQGYTNVRTLLNSGNAVFDAAGRGSGESHAKHIRAAVAKDLGVDAHVIVKSAAEIKAAVAGNVLKECATDPSRLLVALCSDSRALREIAKLRPERGERLHVNDHAAYLWCANGILESRTAVSLLKDLGEAGTTRNWATLGKIAALL